jgi:hypothetical protein
MLKKKAIKSGAIMLLPIISIQPKKNKPINSMDRRTVMGKVFMVTFFKPVIGDDIYTNLICKTHNI